ncbi:MAG TPA: STAS domain-containing protein [Noviherbaspirillum sp.]
MKIDAIESEMSSEFVNVTTTQQLHTTTGPKTAPSPPAKPKPGTPPPAKAAAEPRKPSATPAAPTATPATLQPLSHEFGTTTEFLLGGQTAVGDIAVPASEAAAVVEEAAIMYANGQSDLVEQMLRSAIEEDQLGEKTRTAWLMLFDLYMVSGKQQEFENLSIDYASKFETSPPTWTNTSQQCTKPAATEQGKTTTPMVPFNGKLDVNCAKLVDRADKLAENFRTMRLEFVRVSEVDATGCGMLLDLLTRLQKSGHDLILVGAPELSEKIRGIVEVGRRDESEAPWLLLLELLRLLNREKDFEEASIDYCVTFEVSPPAFVAPKNKVTTDTTEAPTQKEEAEGFLMPALIEGRIDNLIVSIAAYSDEHNPAIIDCSRLVRVDFNAAGRLLTGLAPFCGIGKTIEFHHVNHLVAELFNVIGLKDLVRIVPRKN